MPMNKWQKYFAFILTIVLVIILPSGLDEIFAQCAMCRKNAESSLKDPNSIAQGLNKAIPYLALAFIFREQIKGLYKMLRAKSSNKN